MNFARLARAAGFVFGLAAAYASAQTQATLSVSPNPAPAGQAFVLTLLGTAYGTCAAFSRESVTVAGNRIDLRFTAASYTVPIAAVDTVASPQRAGVVCPVMASSPDAVPLIAPRFNMPSLKAGNYEVWATDMPACLYGQPACAIAVAPKSAGVLTVQGATPHVSWYLKEKTVAPDKAFQMQLLRDGLAACTFFSNQNAVVTGNQIFASFLMQEGDCAMVSGVPLGPVFSLPALKAGMYPVLPQELSACQVAQPPCYPPVKAPIPTDTLVVTQSLAIALSRLRADAPPVELRGDAAVFSLPAGGAGVWRAVLTTLDGRVLADVRLAGSEGDRVSVPVDRAPAHALSLLRLTSPDGVQRLLPVLR